MASLQIGEDIRRVRSEAEEQERMADEVRVALESRPLPMLPSKYFYDERGGALFDEITRLPEYYLTRTEEALLPAVAREVVQQVRPRNLVELGSGWAARSVSSSTRWTRRGRSELHPARHQRERDRELVVTAPIGAAGGEDGGRRRGLLTDLREVGSGESRLIAFLGSTIGNLDPRDVLEFFRSAAAILSPGDAVLVGLDLVRTARASRPPTTTPRA